MAEEVGQLERGPQEEPPPPILTTSPSLSSFVLYAERSIRLGAVDQVCGGDIGVHSIARDPKYEFQTRVGSASDIDRRYNLYSPSVRLGRDVKLGVMQTELIEDDGVLIGSPVPFPAPTMPPLPLGFAPVGPSGGNISVAAGTVTAQTSGNYGAVTVNGTLLLNPGLYIMASLVLTDCASLVAIAGEVEIIVSQYLTAGRRVCLRPDFGRPAGTLVILVSSLDGTQSRPAVSFGEHCYIRALITAPHGTFAVADHSRLAGSFAAFDINLGDEVRVEYQSGFPKPSDREGGSTGGTQQLQGYYGPSIDPDPTVAQVVGPVPLDTNIALTVNLPVQNPQGLETFLKDVSDPKSPTFRKYLTQSEFISTYGATDSDYQELKDWAANNGLSIYVTYPTNLLLGISGTAAQVQRAFFVNLVYRLRSDGSYFVAVDREPSLNLSAQVLSVSGFTEFAIPRRDTVNGTGGCPGAGCGSSYRAADIRNAYLGADSSILKLDGTGQVIGLLELDSYNQSDIAGYAALQKPPLDPSKVILYGIEAPAWFASGYSNNLEVAIDIEMALAMAPGAQILVFQTSTGITLHGDAAYHAMANSSPRLTSASSSWEFGRSGGAQQALDQMAAQGTSFFQSSGDLGDIGDPKCNKNMGSQTLVGGTFLATNALDSPYPNPAYPSTYYDKETTWNQNPPPQGFGVTGGGVMDGNNYGNSKLCWPCWGGGTSIPDYQLGLMQVSAATNGGSTTYRNFPDVAMVADNIETFFGGATLVPGGTSLAAPLWAGFIALVNQWIKRNDPNAGPVGFINPTIYDIGLTRGTVDDLYALSFNDIADNGTNSNGFDPTVYRTVAGYDLCTGLGTPKAGLVFQLGSTTPLTPNQPLALIRFVIGTGNDDLGGGLHGSSATADINLPNGYKHTFELRNAGEANWGNWSTHTVDFALPTDIDPPLTPSNGLASVQIHLVQNNPGWSADNWDITTLGVSLFNQPNAQVCQLNLVGMNQLQDGSTGLVRLSLTPSGSGVGPDSPLYFTGPGSGCP